MSSRCGFVYVCIVVAMETSPKAVSGSIYLVVCRKHGQEDLSAPHLSWLLRFILAKVTLIFSIYLRVQDLSKDANK